MTAEVERSAFIEDLRSITPGVVTDPDVLRGLSRDAADLFSYEAPLPVAAVYPKTTQDVAAVVKVAARHKVAVVPQGSRTGLAGGANAVAGAVLVCLERMNTILEIDPGNRIAVVQPGVINATLRRAAAEVGLFYPPDPSSWEMSSIGGNVSTNAGGLCCVKYGVTSNYVLGLEVVLANGEVLRCGRRTAKGVAGYDLTSLFTGAEGTLGIITEITLALRPLPDPTLTLVAIFDSKAAIGTAITSISASRIQPSMVEMLDRVHIRAVELIRPMGLNPQAEAMLLAGSDARSSAADDVAAMADICRQAGAVEVYVASDPTEAESLLTARRLAQPAMKHLAQVEYPGGGGDAVVEDIAVPKTRIVELLESVDAISKARGITIGFHGHAGDGNLHPTLLMDRNSPASVAAAKAAFDEVLRVTLGLGGTITGEHGVGLLKRDWLGREIGDVGLRVHRAIKAALDPDNLLNPGKMF